MKVFIYFILIIAFLMFYQQNPVFAVIIVGLIIGIYLFFKARKSRGTSSPGSFFSGFRRPQANNMDDFLKFLLLQQITNSRSHSLVANSTTPKKISKRQEQIEKTQKEVLELLES